MRRVGKIGDNEKVIESEGFLFFEFIKVEICLILGCVERGS